MLKRLIGKLLILIGCLSVIGSIAYQILLIYWEFGGLNSGYLILHWSLLGLLGILLFPIGIRLTKRKDKKLKIKESENLENDRD